MPGELAKSRLTTSMSLVTGIDGYRFRVDNASKACRRVSMTIPAWIYLAMLGFIGLIAMAMSRIAASGTCPTFPEDAVSV
jgi:hypothetical protein